jgi:subtilase family serine protease
MKSPQVSTPLFRWAVATLVLFVTSCSNTPPPPPLETRPVVMGEHGTLASCLPRAVATREAAILGAARSQQQLKLEIQLPLRNQAELTRLLRDLYDPRSPNFHKYLSVPAFTERFGPAAADYRKVVAWAKGKGFNVTATTPNRRLVAVEGSVDTVNRAFRVSVNNYRHPTERRTFWTL